MHASSLKIASLLPSTTEIACMLGLQSSLVGRSHECDFPADVETLPVCTSAKIDSSRPSLDIDQQVRTILEQGVSIYNVDADLLRQLQPDIVLTQAQCDVCAVSLKDVEAAMCGWLGHSAKIVSCSPMRLQDIWEDIRAVASACGVPERGEYGVAKLQQRVRAISEAAERLPDKPRIACIEWLEPLMSAGNWVPELVTMAGGINLFGEPGVHSPWFSWEELQASDPDMLIILACGFSMQRTEAEMPALTGHPAWSALRAVRQGHVYITDGNQYFNRPGPRLVESLEILAEIFHPSQFNFGHSGYAWRRFSASIPKTD